MAIDVLVISLERSTARRESVSSRLSSLGIPFEFFDAVDAAAGEHLQFPRLRKNLWTRYGYRMTPGEAGCFASHAALWERCVALGRPAVIMEDNVSLEDGYAAALAAATLEIEVNGVAYIRLSQSLPRRFLPLREIDGGLRLVRYLKGPRGSSAYSLSPLGARMLLNGTKRWAEPLDDYLDRFWVHGLPPLAVHPIMASRADVPTDIPGRKPPTGVQLAYQRLVHNWDGLRRQIANREAGISRRQAVLPREL